MTVPEACQHLLGFLREEQRDIPHVNPDFDDPVPSAIGAINATMQVLAVASPLFAAKKPKSAWFRAPATVAVTGLSVGGMTGTATWPAGTAGCLVQLPGDSEGNRIASIDGTTATFQFPHFGDVAGDAVVSYDTAVLDSDIIVVIDPVRTRGGVELRPASGPRSLAAGVVDRVDYGRVMRVNPGYGGSTSYFVESVVSDDTLQPELRMMITQPPQADFVVGFNARCSLGRFTVEDAEDEDGKVIPVPADFAETLFLPLAVVRFLSSPAMQNYDVGGTTNARALELAQQQVEQGFAMLAKMGPQANRGYSIYPGWR